MRITVGEPCENGAAAIVRGLLGDRDDCLAADSPDRIPLRDREEDGVQLAAEGRGLTAHAAEGMNGHPADARDRIVRGRDHRRERALVGEVVEHPETLEAHPRIRMTQGRQNLGRRRRLPGVALCLQRALAERAASPFQDDPARLERVLQLWPAREAVRTSKAELDGVKRLAGASLQVAGLSAQMPQVGPVGKLVHDLTLSPVTRHREAWRSIRASAEHVRKLRAFPAGRGAPCTRGRTIARPPGQETPTGD